jgi:hypothetical protein
MNVEEARRFLRGEPPKAMKDLKKLEEKDPVKMASANLGNELDQLKEGINSFRRPFERDMIALNSSFLKAGKAALGFSGNLNQAIDRISSRAMGEESEIIDGKAITGKRSSLKRLANMLEEGGFDAETLAKVLTLYTSKKLAGSTGLVASTAAMDEVDKIVGRSAAPTPTGFAGPNQPTSPRQPTTPAPPKNVFPEGTGLTLVIDGMNFVGKIVEQTIKKINNTPAPPP